MRRLGPLPILRVVSRRLRVSLDPTLVFGLTYLGWWFFERYDALARMGGPVETLLSGQAWALLLTAGALLGILAHELGHVLFARLAGGRMAAITLSLLGGRMTAIGGRGVELTAALGGPIASLFLGILLVCAHGFATAAPPDVPLALLDLGRLHLLYGAVNLLPIPPFDGARFLDPLVARKVGVCAAGALVLAALATSLLPLLFAAVYVYAGTDAPRAAPATLSTRPV